VDIGMLDVLTPILARRTALAPPATGDASALLAAFAGAGRRVGKDALDLDGDEIATLRAAGADWPIAARADELWRVALLVAAAGRDDLEHLVAAAYRGGDSDERVAVLRALPLLPRGERFAALAADACRTSLRPIFEAIACENPYPARHLSELHFNQMVLKALFLDVALSRVIGVDARRTPELVRMAADYARERRAAGRPVSADLARLAGEGSTCG
jgi:hypothetical protein